MSCLARPLKSAFRLSGPRLSAFPFSRLIVAVTAAQLILAVGPLIRWHLTGNWDWMAWYFGYPSPLFFVGMNGVTWVLSLAAWKQFLPGQSLRVAWFLISIASGLRLLGSVLTHLLSSPLLLVPLARHGSVWSDPAVHSLWHETGWAIEGPLTMVMLAGGLFILVRLYKRLGLVSKLTRLDHALLGVVGGYSLYVAWTILQIQARSHPTITLDGILHWTGDPLLCVLLFESVFIHRALAGMGWGLITRCWAAFVVAIFLTSVGSMGQWAVNFGYLPFPRSAVTWYVWYAVSAAFALGPAYQLEATYRAKGRLQEPEKAKHQPPAVSDVTSKSA
jgi:hypothetical protein